MVLLPGCSCCSPPDCVTVFNTLKSSSAVLITVNTSDYLKKIKATAITGSAWCNAANGAATIFCKGSAHAGTFSLTKHFESFNTVRWRYLYPTSSTRCGSSITIELIYDNDVPPYTVFFNVIFGLTVFQYRNFVAETYATEQDFSCTQVLPVFCSKPEALTYSNMLLFYRTSCVNNFFSIANPTPAVAWDLPAVSISADERGPNEVLTTTYESGSRDVIFSDIEFVP